LKNLVAPESLIRQVGLTTQLIAFIRFQQLMATLVENVQKASIKGFIFLSELLLLC
jgi:hypothetical protein